MFHNVLYSRDTNHWLQPPFLTATQTASQGLQYLGTCSAGCTPFTNVPIGSGAVSIPTNGSLSISNGDYYGVGATPYQMQWNFNIQREVIANTVATIGYVGSHNLHMFAQKDFNYPVPVIGPTGVPTFASQTGVANARLNPFYSSLQLADNLADSHYNALQTSLNRRFSAGWQAQVSYTWAKSIDNSSGTYGLDGGGAVSNPTSIAYDRGLSNFSRKHNFRVSGIYNIPVKVKGFASFLVNDWQLTGVFTYLSGSPANITSAANRVFSGTGGNTGRPNAVAGCDTYANQSLHGLWFNPQCYTLQAIGTYGNLGRDTIIGPNLWNLDNSLTKDFKVKKISEQFAVQFRAEFFNILNHPSFQNPTTANIFAGNPGAGAQAPGVALNSSAGTITATNSQPRQVQLALKITF